MYLLRDGEIYGPSDVVVESGFRADDAGRIVQLDELMVAIQELTDAVYFLQRTIVEQS